MSKSKKTFTAEVQKEIDAFKEIRKPWDYELMSTRLSMSYKLAMDYKPYLSHTVLAEMMDISRQSISKFLSGEHKLSIEFAYWFAQIFEEDYRYLLGITDVSLLQEKKNREIAALKTKSTM